MTKITTSATASNLFELARIYLHSESSGDVDIYNTVVKYLNITDETVLPDLKALPAVYTYLKIVLKNLDDLIGKHESDIKSANARHKDQGERLFAEISFKLKESGSKVTKEGIESAFAIDPRNTSFQEAHRQTVEGINAQLNIFRPQYNNLKTIVDGLSMKFDALQTLAKKQEKDQAMFAVSQKLTGG